MDYKKIIIEKKEFLSKNYKIKKENYIKIIKKNIYYSLKIFLKLLSIILFIIPQLIFNFNKDNHKFENFICFCVLGKKENLYARELVEYHKNIGYDKIIIVDNNKPNTEKFSDVLQDYINNGIVEIVNVIGNLINQGEFYRYLYEKYKKKCKWLNFFDFDEYLVIYPQKGKKVSVQEYLNNHRFDKCDVVSINWRMYGDNELLHYDNRTLIERFTKPLKEDSHNRFVKSIVRGNLKGPLYGFDFSSHFPSKNLTLCDSSGKIRPNGDSISPPVYEYAQVSHFGYKSTEEYVNKIKRGYPGDHYPNPENNVKLYFSHNKFSKEKLKIFEDNFNMTFDKYHY